MKRLLVMLVMLPLPAWAAGPFDGTWKANLKSANFADNKPVEQSLTGGRYKCVGCDPNVVIDVKADGTDQKVAGTNDFDTANVKVVDASSFKAVYKKSGAVTFEITVSVSPDGKTQTGKWTGHPVQGPPVTGVNTMTRVGAAPAGAHVASGMWKVQKLADMPDAALTVTYLGSADGLTSTQGTGETYTAKFGGPAVPLKNDRAGGTMSIKKLDANTFEETYKQDGKTINVNRMTAHGDTISVVGTDALGSKTTYTLDRVAPAKAR